MPDVQFSMGPRERVRPLALIPTARRRQPLGLGLSLPGPTPPCSQGRLTARPQPIAFAWVPISRSGKSIISADNPACTSPLMTHLRTHPSLSTSGPCILFPSLNVLNPSHLRAFPHAGPLLEGSSALQAESLSIENWKLYACFWGSSVCFLHT